MTGSRPVDERNHVYSKLALDSAIDPRYQLRVAAISPSTNADVTRDSPSSPAIGLRGLIPRTRGGSSGWLPPPPRRLTGVLG